MNKLMFSFLGLFCFSFLGAQSINLDEITINGNLVDSRNGALDFGDIDGDGDPDLIIIGKDGSALKSTLYTNDGNGAFTEVTGTPFVTVQFGTTNFVDVDNDGDQDLMITGSNFSPQNFSNLYLNNGTGTFTLAPGTIFEPISGADVDFIDVDNDGDQDVFMTGTKFDAFTNPIPHAALYLNNGSGGFTLAVGTPFEQVTNSTSAFLDMDGDNDMDLLVSGENVGGVVSTKLYANNGSSGFSLVAGTTFEGITFGAISVADTDGDGDQDVHLLGAGTSGSNISKLYTNNGLGVFTERLGTPFVKSSIGTSDFADFDNDGDMDLLITGSVIGAEFAANIYENQGSNNFVLTDSLEDVYLSSTSITDIDGDGDLDVAMVGISNGGIGGSFATRIYQNSPITLSTDLLSFTASTIDNNTIELNWVTSLEENHDYSILEHSRDGIHFREIAHQKGNGNATQKSHYNFLHKQLSNGWHYYRLKDIDFRGEFEYSEVAAAQIQNNMLELEIFPNPTNGKFSIQSESTMGNNTLVEIINMQGQIISSDLFQNGNSFLSIDISNAPSGIYYARISQGKQLLTQKIIKQ